MGGLNVTYDVLYGLVVSLTFLLSVEGVLEFVTPLVAISSGSEYILLDSKLLSVYLVYGTSKNKKNKHRYFNQIII